MAWLAHCTCHHTLTIHLPEQYGSRFFILQVSADNVQSFSNSSLNLSPVPVSCSDPFLNSLNKFPIMTSNSCFKVNFSPCLLLRSSPWRPAVYCWRTVTAMDRILRGRHSTDTYTGSGWTRCTKRQNEKLPTSSETQGKVMEAKISWSASIHDFHGNLWIEKPHNHEASPRSLSDVRSLLYFPNIWAGKFEHILGSCSTAQRLNLVHCAIWLNKSGDFGQKTTPIKNRWHNSHNNCCSFSCCITGHLRFSSFLDFWILAINICSSHWHISLAVSNPHSISPGPSSDKDVVWLVRDISISLKPLDWRELLTVICLWLSDGLVLFCVTISVSLFAPDVWSVPRLWDVRMQLMK